MLFLVIALHGCCAVGAVFSLMPRGRERVVERFPSPAAASFYAPALRRTVLASAGLAVLSCIVFPFWVVGCVETFFGLCIY